MAPNSKRLDRVISAMRSLKRKMDIPSLKIPSQGSTNTLLEAPMAKISIQQEFDQDWSSPKRWVLKKEFESNVVRRAPRQWKLQECLQEDLAGKRAGRKPRALCA